MNTPTPEQKQPVMKTLALAGLLGVIVFIAWLAVQIVQALPTAISYIAATADSVYKYNPLQTSELKLSRNETLVNANQPFSLSWTRPYASGTYAFSYACNEHISLNLTAAGKEFSNLECNKQYDLGSVDTITLSIDTSQERFTEVSYTIAFYRPNSPTPAASQSATTTIVNADIIENTAENEAASSTVAVVEEPKIEIVSTTTTPVIATSTTSTSTPVKPEVKPIPPTKPVVSKPVYTYEIPSSNPNGTPDLVTSYIGIGTLSDSGVFTKTNVINLNQTGAIQFSVHNIGNKTSDTWSYLAKLPGNTSFRSENEKPLLPNERAVITIQFNPVTKSYFEDFSVTVNTKSDANLNTNSFTAGAIVLQ